METGDARCLMAMETMPNKFHALHCPVVVYAGQQTMA